MTVAGGKGNDKAPPDRPRIGPRAAVSPFFRPDGVPCGRPRPAVRPAARRRPPVTDLLERASELSTVAIAVLFAAHLFCFWVLAAWCGGSLRKLAATLESFTRGLRHRSVVGTSKALPDQINAFLADVADALDAPPGDAAAAVDRAALRERIETLDESRRYLPGLSFEAAASTAPHDGRGLPAAGGARHDPGDRGVAPSRRGRAAKKSPSGRSWTGSATPSGAPGPA